MGLTNPGIEWWCKKIGPKLDFKKFPLVASIFGDEKELVEMAKMLNQFDFVAIEINVSCPNADHDSVTETIVRCVKAVKAVSRHPVIVKVSVDQYCVEIAKELDGTAEAMSFNSVKWETVYPKEQSPLHKLEKKVGGGGGGVSGGPAQPYNWAAMQEVILRTKMPVIASSVMSEMDVHTVKFLGAHAVAFGSIHIRTPWKPTSIVRKEMGI